jgi:hypothetical protein
MTDHNLIPESPPDRRPHHPHDRPYRTHHHAHRANDPPYQEPFGAADCDTDEISFDPPHPLAVY